MEADCSKSGQEVYTTVARRIVESDDNLRILSEVPSQAALGLLSWVVGWSQPLRDFTQLNTCQDDLTEGKPFQAAGASQRVLAKTSKVDTLCLRGFRADVVKETRNPSDNPAAITGLSEHYPFIGELVRDAHLRTVTADYGPFSDRIPNDFRDWRYPPHERGKISCHGMQQAPAEAWEELAEWMKSTTANRDLFITEKGNFGLGPSEMRVGGVVCILLGGPVRYILCQQNDSEFRFRGECYVHDTMDGEAPEDASEGDFEDFVLK